MYFALNISKHAKLIMLHIDNHPPSRFNEIERRVYTVFTLLISLSFHLWTDLWVLRLTVSVTILGGSIANVSPCPFDHLPACSLTESLSPFIDCVCLSVDRSVSALYLQQYSPDPFYIHASYSPTCDFVSHAKFPKKVKLYKDLS